MSKYEEYLEKYCKKHEIAKEVAENHSLVKEVKKHYEQNTVHGGNA